MKITNKTEIVTTKDPEDRLFQVKFLRLLKIHKGPIIFGRG